MPIFKFLHIACMFIGVAFSIGGGWFLERLAATHDLRAVRAAVGTTRPLPMLINGFLGVGVLLGLVTAYFDQFNFLAPWLIASYIIFIILSVLGGAVTGKWFGQLGASLAKYSGDTLTPDIQKILDDPMPRRVFWVNVVGILVVIFLMVFKPGGV
jgi:hypothetical protein